MITSYKVIWRPVWSTVVMLEYPDECRGVDWIFWVDQSAEVLVYLAAASD